MAVLFLREGFNQLGAMAGVGYEDAFPRPKLSARSRFSQRTFAGTHGNGRGAPIPDICCASQGGLVIGKITARKLGSAGS